MVVTLLHKVIEHLTKIQSSDNARVERHAQLITVVESLKSDMQALRAFLLNNRNMPGGLGVPHMAASVSHHSNTGLQRPSQPSLRVRSR